LAPDQWQDSRWQALVELVVAAGRLTLNYFQDQRLAVDRKADRSPVTIADREAEQQLRTALSNHFPEDSIAGEEFGASGAQQSRYQWIIDPIDGTKSFICGVPLYSTLLGLTDRGVPVAGAIFIPALNELVVAARGMGTWWRRGGAAWLRTSTSHRRELSQGVLLTSEFATFAPRGATEAFVRLQAAASICRTWGDGYGYLLVATGRAEAMVDPIVNPWDVAAIAPVIEEAGGRWSNWNGQQSIDGGDFVGTNGLVHDEVLRGLR
jgi:histidinol-phosphatase